MNDKSYMIPLGESEIRDLLASNKAFKEANEAVKITVFNWTPQYLKACSDFKVSRRRKCRQTFQLTNGSKQDAGNFERAKNAHNNRLAAACFERAAFCYKKASLPPSVSECLDLAAKSYPETAEYFYNQCAQTYLEAGEPEKAAETFTKLAAATEMNDPGKAMSLYLKAIDFYDIEDFDDPNAKEMTMKATSLAKALDTLRAVFAKLVRAREYDAAIRVGHKLKNAHIMAGQSASSLKMNVALVILHLAKPGGDVGGARKVMAALVGDGVGSEGTREYETCEDMVNAWENGDADSWTSIASSFLVKNLDREVAGLAMKLTPGMPPVSNLAGQQPPPPIRSHLRAVVVRVLLCLITRLTTPSTSCEVGR